MPTYTYCETIRGSVRLHIRPLSARGRRPHKKPDTKTLCGASATRDFDIPIKDYYLTMLTCTECVQAYAKILQEESDNGKSGRADPTVGK